MFGGARIFSLFFRNGIWLDRERAHFDDLIMLDRRCARVCGRIVSGV